MRWKKHELENGTRRTIVKFAFLPIEIGGEVRWLERVAIDQEWVSVGCNAGTYVGWQNLSFNDKWLDEWYKAKEMAKHMA